MQQSSAFIKAQYNITDAICTALLIEMGRLHGTEYFCDKVFSARK